MALSKELQMLVLKGNFVLLFFLVAVPPTLRPMSNQQAEENKRVTLLCTGEGVPLPSLTWQKGSDAPFAQGSQAVSMKHKTSICFANLAGKRNYLVYKQSEIFG